ncbi:MAG: hypothetical protein QOH51_2233 [Acidobacteriota bacterium]|jgi:photosystem II stability/assembly factor-like uncharacterized protein|nr:hypothetical protein [Acidobacteriota bacterium]
MSTRKGKGGGAGSKSASRKKGASKKAASKTSQPVEIKAASERNLDVPPKEDLIVGLIQPQTQIGSGPRKLPSKGKPTARLSNHKARSAWISARAAWPAREAPIRALVQERELARKTLPPSPGTSQWEPVGPTNIGGRMTSIVCHPKFPERIWAGAAGGGVWFSPDAGQSWQSQWYSQDVLNVGSLAIDPTNPDIIYCGTGEANLSADSYPGVGIYQTTDAGKTWRLLASKAATKIPGRIGVIAIDPFNPKHLRIGGVSHAMGGHLEAEDKDLGGMYFSLDGGLTWQRETFISENNYWCHSIIFHPTRKGIIFATFTERGARNGFYKSADGGQNWRQITKGLPDPQRIGRMSLAISLSNPDVLYAFAADELSQYADMMLGVFRTQTGGESWTNMAGTHFNKEQQISYGNTIAVHPKNPNHVICGGVDLHLSTDGGKTWKRATHWDADRGKPIYAHADHHGLLMPAGAPGRVYDPNDGGLDMSEDGGLTWVNRSNGLAATMYYDMDVAQSDGRTFGGGAQDNGTLITTSGHSNDHREILGGDGGWIVFDPADASRLYASYYNLNIFRFVGGAITDVSPPADDNEKNSVWMAFIALDVKNPRTVFTGSYRVWRTLNDGNTWKAVSAALDGSPISAIEIASADSKRIYVGTENGGFFRSTDGGNTWSANMAGATLPGMTITRLAASPSDARLLYATVANFGHSHIFRSHDGGVTWEDIDKGQLPDVPHHSIAIPPDSPSTIYVCNDVGVFVSLDSGNTWMSITRNLPNTMVVDLVYQRKDGTLSAATYGRSIWRLKVK